MSDNVPVVLPLQPTYVDEQGVRRFRKNEIVVALLDTGKLDMNDLACLNFPKEDRIQFATLIGYSVSGFSDLGYVSNTAWEAANAETGSAFERRAVAAEVMLQQLRTALQPHLKLLAQDPEARSALANLLNEHPDDVAGA